MRYSWLVAIALFSQPLAAETFSSQVLAVLDGDTLLINYKNQQRSVRLADIDAPEKKQPYGAEALAVLNRLVANRTVTFKVHQYDKYGRLIADVYSNKQHINAILVKSGWAWEYSYFHRNQFFVELQREAQQQKRGLWAGKTPIAPSQWRKENSLDRCQQKHWCSQMSNCQEALFYLKQCHFRHLDNDQDGVPCETLCQPH